MRDIQPMSSLAIVIFVLRLVVLLAVINVVVLFNALVTLRHRITAAYAQIDGQLKRRYELILNLVETANGYLKHERGTLEAVLEARYAAATANTGVAAKPGDPSAMHVLASSEITLNGTLDRLFALTASYPDLKVNATMLRLMEDLTSTENKLVFFRQAFNAAVKAYNTKRELFPSSVIAETFCFSLAGMFAIQHQEERLAPPAVLV